jgi:hypothetical protein
MVEEIKLIPRLLARSGAIVSIGFENSSQYEAIVVSASLQCSARPKAIYQPMLFGIPLAILSEQRSIRVGISAFELAIQGYSLSDPMNPLARRHFEHIFKMVSTRMPRIASAMSSGEDSQAFVDAAIEFAKQLIALPDNDSDECSERLGKLDSALTHELNVKWLTRSGEIISKHFDLNSKTVAWWLSNHVTGTEGSLI